MQKEFSRECCVDQSLGGKTVRFGGAGDSAAEGGIGVRVDILIQNQTHQPGKDDRGFALRHMRVRLSARKGGKK